VAHPGDDRWTGEELRNSAKLEHASRSVCPQDSGMCPLVPIDGPDMHDHLMRASCLAQELTAPLPDISAKHLISILRHPNQVIFAVSNRVAATLVGSRLASGIRSSVLSFARLGVLQRQLREPRTFEVVVGCWRSAGSCRLVVVCWSGRNIPRRRIVTIDCDD